MSNKENEECINNMIPVTAMLPAMARKPKPLNEKRVQIAGRILPDLLNGLKELADAEERTLSFLLEKAVAEFLERRHAKPKPPRPRQ